MELLLSPRELLRLSLLWVEAEGGSAVVAGGFRGGI